MSVDKEVDVREKGRARERWRKTGQGPRGLMEKAQKGRVTQYQKQTDGRTTVMRPNGTTGHGAVTGIIMRRQRRVG